MPKFRAWDKLNESMCDVANIDFMTKVVELRHAVPFYFLPFSEVALMQATGLKDKNGVEIFEGDILYHPLQGKREVYYPYSDFVASYGLREINTGFGSTLQDADVIWKVIGNIYENSNLIK